MAKKNGSPAYLEALKELTHIINTEYPDGGKLPGALDMCKRLNVCMVTYIKILKILCRESLLSASKGRGGTHVRPYDERRRKIGIVIRGAEDSPFLGEFMHVCAAFQELNREGFVAHQIQAAKMDQIYDKAIFHGVCGLLWFSPPDLKAAAVVEKIQKETDMPLVALNINSRPVRSFFEEHLLNAVIQNPDAEYRKTVKFAVSRGHKTILRIDCYDSIYSIRFIQAAKEQGMGVHYLPPARVKKELLSKLRDTGSSLILSEGGYQVYQAVFDQIAALPREKRPEVLIRKAGNMPEQMTKLYPDLVLPGQLETDESELVRQGTRMLMNHIRVGKEIHFMKKDVFSIGPVR